jgi:hypothetical protein
VSAETLFLHFNRVGAGLEGREEVVAALIAEGAAGGSGFGIADGDGSGGHRGTDGVRNGAPKGGSALREEAGGRKQESAQ